ncbi:MAG: phage tail tube protein [Rhodospirillaceae bacterium]
MSDAVTGNGTIVYRETTGASPSSFTAIGEVKSIQGPGGSPTIIDVTHLTSTGREKLAGLLDEGQITMTMNRLSGDAQQNGLLTDRINRTRRGFRIIFPDAEQFDFMAFVTGATFSTGVDQARELQVTLEVTGVVGRS